MARGKVTVAELTGRGVTLTVELVEIAGTRRIEITGPKYRASFPQCPCDNPACVGPGVWGRHCKEGYDHSFRYCHGDRGSGYHAEHVEVFARSVLKTFPAKAKAAHKPAAPKRQEHRDLNRAVNHFAPLDGEEEVRIVTGRREGTPSYKAANQWSVVCSSRRCYKPINEPPYTEPIAVVTAEREGSGLYEREREEAEQQAYDARNAHIAWHRETFGISGRVLLDRWLVEHAMLSAPEPDRAELDRELAIAKAGA